MEHRTRGQIDLELVGDFNRQKTLGQLVGTFPLRLTPRGLVVSPGGVAWSVATVMVMLGCAVAHVLFPILDLHFLQNSPAILLAYYINYFALNLFFLIQLWATVLRRGLLYRTFRTLSEVKGFLEVFGGGDWRPQRRFWSSVVHGVAFSSTYFLDPANKAGTLPGLVIKFGYYFFVVVMFWSFVPFLWTADSLAEGFRGLAAALDRHIAPQDVDTLIRCYFLLANASCRLNRVYSLGLTVAFLISFFLALSSAYAFIFDLLRGLPIINALFLFFWTFFLIMLFFRIVGCCSHVIQEAKNFDAALYRTLVHRNNSRIGKSSTEKIFFHFSGKKEVVFTLSGSFKLDWSLLYSMLAAGCTYLAVIVQMDRSN